MIIWTLLFIGVISWRNDVYYSGGLDPVVVAKAALSLLALFLALMALAQAERLHPVGARTIAIVGGYLLVSLVGAWSTGSLLPSAVLTVRVMIVAVVIVLMVIAHPMDDVFRGLCVGMVVVGMVCTVTGLGSLSSGGRLTGGLFPINSNQIALLFGTPTIAIIWRMLQRRARKYDLLLVVVFTGITWLTGSRTGLLALLIAIVVLVVQTRPLPIPAFLGCVAALPAIVYLVFATGLIDKYFGRGGTQNLTSFNSRTIAWESAFSTPTDFWQHWFGAGLAVKTVGVSGTYWDSQVLDSSWVSAYVQAGVIGISLLGLWSLVTLASSFRTRPPWRALWTAVVIYSLIRSLLSSGLIDAHILFVVMFLASLAVEKGTREDPAWDPPPVSHSPRSAAGWRRPAASSGRPRLP